MAAPAVSVLFVCNLNRVRSPMAEALAKAAGLTAVDSCGLVDAEEIDPFVEAVLAEIGVAPPDEAPKTFDALAGARFDLVVALAPEAHARAEATLGMARVAVEYWPMQDPTLETGAREQRLEAYRSVRDALRRRIAERFGLSTGDGGSG
jgi:protein-tyrosine-phosphatase